MLEAEADIAVVGEADSGEEALCQLYFTHPDIVVMDIKMPGMGGIEAIRRIKAQHPRTSVIVFTLFSDQHLAAAIEAGASGYLVKDAGGEELVQAIRRVHQGQSVLQDTLSRGLFDEFAAMARGDGSCRNRLTPREMQMLRLVATGATNREIGGQLFLSETTVKRDISHIFEKLEVRDRAEAVSESYRRGLL